MKYALMIYGGFRTFRYCFHQLLKYIHFDELDYDVFILTERLESQNWSEENEEIIRKMLGSKLKVFFYVQDIEKSYNLTENENKKVQEYYEKVEECKKEFKHIVDKKMFITDTFCSKLFYRVWLQNQIRIKYEQDTDTKYDWIVRTRFDIGFRKEPMEPRLDILYSKPTPDIYYCILGMFSCGSPEVINYESNFINSWCHCWNYYKQNKRLPSVFYTDDGEFDEVFFHYWVFMPEANIRCYMKDSKYPICELNVAFQAVRYWLVDQYKIYDLKNKK